MPDFLDELDLTQTVRERLRALGATDARTLRAMYRAVPGEFTAYVGSATDHVLAQLDAILPREEEAPALPERRLGALLGPPTQGPLEPRFELALRDRLFDELQAWRAEPPSTERDEAIADLEARLNALLDGT